VDAADRRQYIILWVDRFVLDLSRYQKKCCRGMDPLTFTRPVLSMCGTMYNQLPSICNVSVAVLF